MDDQPHSCAAQVDAQPAQVTGRGADAPSAIAPQCQAQDHHGDEDDAEDGDLPDLSHGHHDQHGIVGGGADPGGDGGAFIPRRGTTEAGSSSR